MRSHPRAVQWRERAADRHVEGNEVAARVYERCADELDEFETQQQLEAISLDQAAMESGYSKAHLGRLITQGNLANVGKKGAPRILRQDLPRKPHRPRHSDEPDGPDLVGQVFSRLGLTPEEP